MCAAKCQSTNQAPLSLVLTSELIQASERQKDIKDEIFGIGRAIQHINERALHRNEPHHTRRESTAWEVIVLTGSAESCRRLKTFYSSEAQLLRSYSALRVQYEIIVHWLALLEELVRLAIDIARLGVTEEPTAELTNLWRSHTTFFGLHAGETGHASHEEEAQCLAVSYNVTIKYKSDSFRSWALRFATSSSLSMWSGS